MRPFICHSGKITILGFRFRAKQDVWRFDFVGERVRTDFRAEIEYNGRAMPEVAWKGMRAMRARERSGAL